MKFVVVLLAAVLAVDARIVPVSLFGKASDRIPNEYVVQFEPSARAQFDEFKSKRFPGANTFEIGQDYFGFSGSFDEEQLQFIQAMDGVMLIEPNIVMNALGVQTDVRAWGVDRSDQRALPLDQTYRWHDNADGTGSDVYVLDTGIDTRHVEFEGRAKFAADCVGARCTTNNDPGDPQGHGTHCAGTIASRLWGIAKNATLYNVRVLSASGSGSVAGIIRGMEFVNNAPGQQKIISMSLGGGYSAAMNNAVDASHRAGVVNVVAAGNSNNNACTLSPASAELALTVAASDIRDRKASFSSYGPCVQVWGPGVNILSARPNGGSVSLSGTSMACPHVAGGIALIRSRDPDITADAAVQLLVDQSTPDVIGNNPTGTPNLLLYTFAP